MAVELQRISAKRASLAQIIKTVENRPKLIMLQETLAEEIGLSGFNSVCKGKEPGRGIATLIDKKIPYIEHDLKLGASKIEYILIEMVLKRHRGKAQSLFCLNIYSSPREMRQSFRAIFNKAMRVAKTAPLIIGGTSTPHTNLGVTAGVVRKGKESGISPRI